jgi:flagellar protein FliS
MYAEYDEHEVLNREPIELVRLLYGKAIEKLSLARALDRNERIRERNQAIARASEILIELQGSIDAESGGEIAANLERLYEYIQQRLAAGLAERTNEPLAEAAGLLEILAEGWRDASAALGRTAAPAPETLAAAEEQEESLVAAGRTWTL